MVSKLKNNSKATTRLVEREYWEDVFSQAVRDNRKNIVVIEILDELGDQELLRGKWLSSMVPQTKRGKTEIELTYEHYSWDRPERLTHYVKAPVQVWVLERPNGTAEVFEIELKGGNKVLVRFLKSEKPAD